LHAGLGISSAPSWSISQAPISAAKRKQLIRRFAAAAVLAEQLEGRLANGEQIDIQEHATLSSTLVRLAQRIGIDRVAKSALTLDEYLAALPRDDALVPKGDALGGQP
jgi:hypothetical protein